MYREEEMSQWTCRRWFERFRNVILIYITPIRYLWLICIPIGGKEHIQDRSNTGILWDSMHGLTQLKLLQTFFIHGLKTVLFVQFRTRRLYGSVFWKEVYSKKYLWGLIIIKNYVSWYLNKYFKTNIKSIYSNWL